MIGHQFPEGGQPIPGWRDPDPDLYEDWELLADARETYPHLHPALRQALQCRGLMPTLTNLIDKERKIK